MYHVWVDKRTNRRKISVKILGSSIDATVRYLDTAERVNAVEGRLFHALNIHAVENLGPYVASLST